MTAPPGPDTTSPYAIDRGDDGTQTPGTYKGLWLRLINNGEPAVTAVGGVIGVVCIGMSNATQECSDYITKRNGVFASQVNTAVKVVDCAVGGNAIESWNNVANDAQLWTACINTKIPAAGLTPSQVRVIYHKAANQFTTSGGVPLPTYPAAGSDYENFIANLTAFSVRVAQKFPSVQAVYTTSRMYAGFSTNAGRGEPLSYEEGHALNTWLRANPTAQGLWQGWGPYIWGPDCATGLTNKSNVCYVLGDFQADGVHPAQGARDKISQMIHDRFRQHAWYRP